MKRVEINEIIFKKLIDGVKHYDFCDGTITRPPQSYMYIEEV